MRVILMRMSHMKGPKGGKKEKNKGLFGTPSIAPPSFDRFGLRSGIYRAEQKKGC